MIGKTDNITLESVNIERDRDLLSEWLSNENISKWWGDPVNRLSQIEETSSNRHALICTSALPIGYIAWQEVIREELDSVGLTNVPDNTIDFDIFIGDPAYRGQGIGPKAIDLLLLRLRKNNPFLPVGLVTSFQNSSAIAAFEKSGFHKKYQFESPSFGKCWFMEGIV